MKKYKVKSSDHSKNSNCINYLIDVEANKPLTHIATDLTYIHTKNEGWVYQIAFLDTYTRKILHFNLSSSMDSVFVNKSTSEFLVKYPHTEIIHSDRGSQYTSNSYRKLLKDKNVLASYSSKGYPYHNAKIKSYHASLKIECLYRINILDLNQGKIEAFKYNYGFYNNKRIHQSLGHITPNDFEHKCLSSV